MYMIKFINLVKLLHILNMRILPKSWDIKNLNFTLLFVLNVHRCHICAGGVTDKGQLHIGITLNLEKYSVNAMIT
uniref:Uncharacterized protein n=1 Tax=Romanomermis culicivorax TaxID=13658 RepID=A0A915JWW8_ROMCU